jgi:hypothetical protein
MIVILYKYNDCVQEIDINVKVGHPTLAGQGVGQVP